MRRSRKAAARRNKVIKLLRAGAPSHEIASKAHVSLTTVYDIKKELADRRKGPPTVEESAWQLGNFLSACEMHLPRLIQADLKKARALVRDWN
jgi:hypothetical protein